MSRRRRPPRNDAERERLARRAADVRRCRARLRASRAIYPFEADAQTFDLAVRYAGLDPGRISDRQTTISALSRLLRMALAALVRERARHLARDYGSNAIGSAPCRSPHSLTVNSPGGGGCRGGIRTRDLQLMSWRASGLLHPTPRGVGNRYLGWRTGPKLGASPPW